MKRAMIVAVALVLVILPRVTLAKPPAEVPSLSSALHLLPPLGDAQGKSDRFDQSLIDFLTVTICRVEGSGCATVQEYTSQKDKKGLGYIKLQNHQYHLNWDVDKNQAGKEFEIHFAVAGLEIGSVSYTPGKGKTVPVKFCIDNHPRIRCRVLHEQGYSAPEIATVLKDEFDLGPRDTAQILADDGFPANEVGLALKEVFDLDAAGAAQILKDVGFSAVDVGTALRDVFGLDAQATAQILKDVGFSAVEVGTALRDVFNLDAQATAQILKDVGFSAVDVVTVMRDVYAAPASVAYEVLTELFGLSDISQIEEILAAGGYGWDAIFSVTDKILVKEFAPILVFDEDAETFPMDAEKWVRLHNPSAPMPHLVDCQWRACCDEDELYRFRYREQSFADIQNGNPAISTLSDSIPPYQVPTYYFIDHCPLPYGPKRQLRIQYWWFYGMQLECFAGFGFHFADWEHILVTTSQDKKTVKAVTYYQHDGQYTKLENFGVEMSGTHPIVYVGQLHHGSYHDGNDTAGECEYFADDRAGGPRWETWKTPLLLLEWSNGYAQNWMEHVFAWGYHYEDGGLFEWDHEFCWGEGHICSQGARTAMQYPCGEVRTCKSKGCYKGHYSACRRGDVRIHDYSKCYTGPQPSMDNTYYTSQFLIPFTDGGFTANDPLCDPNYYHQVYGLPIPNTIFSYFQSQACWPDGRPTVMGSHKPSWPGTVWLPLVIKNQTK